MGIFLFGLQRPFGFVLLIHKGIFQSGEMFLFHIVGWFYCFFSTHFLTYFIVFLSDALQWEWISRGFHQFTLCFGFVCFFLCSWTPFRLIILFLFSLDFVHNLNGKNRKTKQKMQRAWNKIWCLEQFLGH